jgi:Fur family ferric uptake transcriptional regulator
MTSVKDSFRSLLKEQGYSVTRARLVTFEALLGQEPLSMHQLIMRVAGVDRASIYRTVDLLERLGIVQRLNTGWKYKLELTDKLADHHHHLTCTQCGQTIAMSEQELEHFIESIACRHGFAPTAHQVEIQGLCAQCRGAHASAAGGAGGNSNP